MIYMNYGTKLKELRTNLNLNQQDIADILNVARITYNHYETQEKIIPLERLIALCNYYKVSLDYIFNFTNKKIIGNPITINKSILGKNLKKFRQTNKITQAKLAEVLNTNHSVIANYESGRYLITTSFLYEICKKYNISADHLLEDTN